MMSTKHESSLAALNAAKKGPPMSRHYAPNLIYIRERDTVVRIVELNGKAVQIKIVWRQQ